MLAVLLRLKIMPSNISNYQSNVVSNVNSKTLNPTVIVSVATCKDAA